MNTSDVPFGESGPIAYDPDSPADSARSSAERQLLAMPGVHGVGEGADATGAPAWIAYVDTQSAGATLPKTISGRPVVIEISGSIDAQLL